MSQPDQLLALMIEADKLEEAGDQGAQQFRNYLEGANTMLRYPGNVGDKVLIQTVTLYWIGEVKEIGVGYIVLKDASWVHWTGRISELCRTLDFKKLRQRTPRVEPCGEVEPIIANQSIVTILRGEWKLPKEAM